jgi:hypothetical protein
MGMAGASDQSSLDIFNAFVTEDLQNGTVYNSNAAGWSAIQSGQIGGFDLSEVSDMTNSLRTQDKMALIPVDGIKPNGHLYDGVRKYIQP